MIDIRNLSYRKKGRPCLEEFSWRIGSRDLIFLRDDGTSHATLLCELLCGVRPASGGSITVNGYGMEQNSIACKKQIGYCPASFCPSGWETVTEFLTFIAQAKGVFEKKIPSRIRELLTETGLSDRANKALRLLTPHEKKCLGLAQALLGNPDILVIDGAKDASTAFLTRVLAAGENKTLILGFGEGKIPPLLRTLERKGVCATLSENGLLLESVEAANETVFADENLNEDEEGDVEDDAEDDENNDGNNDENNVFDDEETAEEKGEDN